MEYFDEQISNNFEEMAKEYAKFQENGNEQVGDLQEIINNLQGIYNQYELWERQSLFSKQRNKYIDLKNQIKAIINNIEAQNPNIIATPTPIPQKEAKYNTISLITRTIAHMLNFPNLQIFIPTLLEQISILWK